MDLGHSDSQSPMQPALNKDIAHDRIAQAVAVFLSLTITMTVEKSVQPGIEQLKNEMGEHSMHLNRAKMRISMMKDELYQT